MKLFLASVFVLGILSTMLFTLFFTLFYVVGMIPWYILLSFTLLVNFLVWLFGPYVSDWMFRFFYKLQWIGIEGLERRDKEIADLVRKICRKNNIKVPKIGYINDDNPTSFTYGSAAFNARIVFTEGIFTYLDREEIKTVLAHEVGHVVHRDFIVLTIASVFVQLFYQLYKIGAESGKGGEKKKGGAAAVAAVGYVFYIIGNYIVLYLSRLREYYADEFSARETGNPNALSSALIKIAYGIIKNPDKQEQLHLLKSTRSQNIFDFKIAKRIGLAYANASMSKSWKPVEGALLYDRYNPWAAISELSSTHPVTGKRINALCLIAQEIGQKPLFDMQTLFVKYNVDRERLYRNFGRDLFFMCMPVLFAIVLPVAYVLLSAPALHSLSTFISAPAFPTIAEPATGRIFFYAISMLSLLLCGIGIGSLVRVLYSFSTSTGFPKTTVADLMGDIYTSPVRGKPARLKGRIVGRGVAGLIFSEDMMFQDSTGLMYLNYEGLLPLVSNLAFALTKVKSLVDKDCEIEGWFVRSIYQMIHLKNIAVGGEVIKSRVRLLGIIASAFWIIVGIAAFILVSAYIGIAF